MDIYDKAGRPISVDEWGRLNMDLDYKIIEQTEVGPYQVSTVWLGLDHRFLGEGPPVIFETMVFTKSAWNADRSDPDRELMLDIDCQRYCTEAEAQAGHEAMCLLIRATMQDVETLKEVEDPEK